MSFWEKFILRTCCYLPPKSSALNVYHIKITDIAQYKNIYELAFGSDLWHEVNEKVVLDFGCGRGEFVLAAAMNGVKLAMGVDIQDNFNNAKELAKAIGLSNVHFILGDSNIIESKSVDVLTSHDAFEHFEYPEVILEEMIRIVKPNGRIYIKFGPTWMSPWGKHMFGTFRKDRPWIHLFFPEKWIMRIHSVYHNEDVILEKYSKRPGGLNKMTVKRCRKIISANSKVILEKFKVDMVYNLDFLKSIPLLNELFSSGVLLVLRVK
ncbi:MAG: class I SAM-dependent methyltransferase [Cyclobacteriaceae bacterium]|nr:class I SAM-dependent methyltransferase [Cyclobacteriaceae bacterium]